MDLAANLKATRVVVERALAVYSISAKGQGKPALDAYLGEARKKEVLSDCYQLLLIRAETEAQSASLGPSSGQEPRLREALRLLEQSLRFGPPSRAYHLRAARYRRLLGDTAGARREETAAAGVPVRDVLDHFLVGDEYYRRGAFDDAIREFTRVLDRQPGHFWAEYLSALCLLRLKRPAEARTQLGACLAQRADFVWIYLLRSIAHGELQDFEAAEADLKKALALPLDDSARYVLLVTRGVQRVRQKRFEDAVADLKEAIARKPKEYQAHVNLATAYHRLKKPDEALAELNRAVDLEPTLARLYRLRALLYVERNEPAKALADLDQAVRRENPASPDYPDHLVERGRLLLQARKHADALASFDDALRRRKDHPLAQRLRADALFQLGRYKEVVEAFDHYLETGKPLESVYRGRGLAHAALGQYPAAIEDYTKALEMRPTSAVQAYRGWAHLVCDAPKLALRDFELAVKLDADNADAYCGRGFLLAGKGRTRDAVRDAELALKKGKRSPRLLYNVARIYAQCGAGNESRAVELLRQSLGLMPAAQRAKFWNSYVRKDAALEKVRRLRSFGQLEAEVTRGR
jgi:tetratricopeptide (TPR) repeat protein